MLCRNCEHNFKLQVRTCFPPNIAVLQSVAFVFDSKHHTFGVTWTFPMKRTLDFGVLEARRLVFPLESV
jgi:hypothetical protein